MTCEILWSQRTTPTGRRHKACYGKWTKKAVFGSSNHGDVVKLANSWLREQGILTEDDPDFKGCSGRKALAKWTTKLHVCSRTMRFL